MRRGPQILIWSASTWLILGSLVFTLGFSDNKKLFLPGDTTHGHHQIELRCAECHTPWGSVDNNACNRCHGAELAAVRDTHPRSKFQDPRNAELLTRLDAASCATCHREHEPEVTHAMGVTQPPDYCIHCHGDIASERPSHAGMAFATCSSVGCHNFHDNSALYEDFIEKHLDEPATLATPRVPALRNPPATVAHTALRAADAAFPAAVQPDPSTLTDWADSAHAAAGVNCADCHQAGNPGAAWVERPEHPACARCHDAEADGFLAGRHGMRLAAGLSPMTPADARLPMRADAAHRELTCNSCHGAHRYDTRAAAVSSCLGCHDDRHSRAYTGSAHFELWRAESAGEGPAGSGVSCATCHLPRVTTRVDGADVVRTEHNQNATLRPPEKMLRTSCLHCHGYGFATDALADPAGAATNFQNPPAVHVESVDLVRRRVSGKSRQPNP